MDKKKKIDLMTHMVAFYPDPSRAMKVAQALADAGAAYLEIQFPYSDPSADGPAIQRACTKALQNGFTKKEGFDFVQKVTEAFSVPVFIMSYGGLVYSGGVERFVSEAKEAGAAGLIIPDLSPGHDEGLYRVGREAGINVVPVTAPSVTDQRLQRIKEEAPRYVYAALRAGVTGRATELGKNEFSFLERLRPLGAEVIAGFGIRERRQVEALAPHVNTLVVGSMIVDIVEKNVDSDDTLLYEKVKGKVEYLINGGAE